MLLFARSTVPLSIRQSILLRLLARLDQKIAETESQLLRVVSADELHSIVGHVADLHSRRKKLEARLKSPPASSH
jgi:hypothetical protein